MTLFCFRVLMIDSPRSFPSCATCMRVCIKWAAITGDQLDEPFTHTSAGYPTRDG